MALYKFDFMLCYIHWANALSQLIRADLYSVPPYVASESVVIYHVMHPVEFILKR